MKKNVFGRQFKRDKNERAALFKSLASSLILYGSIQTTEAKAKAVKGSIEKLITKAKKGTQSSNFASFIYPNAIKKLEDVALLFNNRSGGYTRIVHMGNRMHDGASIVMLELVEQPKAMVAVETKKENQRSKIKDQKPEPKSQPHSNRSTKTKTEKKTTKEKKK